MRALYSLWVHVLCCQMTASPLHVDMGWQYSRCSAGGLVVVTSAETIQWQIKYVSTHRTTIICWPRNLVIIKGVNFNLFRRLNRTLIHVVKKCFSFIIYIYVNTSSAELLWRTRNTYSEIGMKRTLNYVVLQGRWSFTTVRICIIL